MKLGQGARRECPCPGRLSVRPPPRLGHVDRLLEDGLGLQGPDLAQQVGVVRRRRHRHPRLEPGVPNPAEDDLAVLARQEQVKYRSIAPAQSETVPSSKPGICDLSISAHPTFAANSLAPRVNV